MFTHAMNKLFNYLNRFYLKNNQSKLIADEAMQIYREYTYKNMQKNLLEALLGGINRDRDGENTEIDVMRQIIGTFKDMGLKKPITQMEGGLLQWVGEKNLQTYREDFE